jgi:hypothetical protein
MQTLAESRDVIVDWIINRRVGGRKGGSTRAGWMDE